MMPGGKTPSAGFRICHWAHILKGLPFNFEYPGDQTHETWDGNETYEAGAVPVKMQ